MMRSVPVTLPPTTVAREWVNPRMALVDGYAVTVAFSLVGAACGLFDLVNHLRQ